MISKLSVPLLALSICCALAQNQDSSNAEAQALSQGRGQENRGRGRGNQNQQNSNCLARCMTQGITASQRVIDRDFRDVCSSYRSVASCLSGCGGRDWDSVGDDLNDYCRNEDRRTDRFDDCYRRWLDPAQDTCLRQCSRGSKSWIRTNNLGTYCNTLHCYMPCIINNLNRRCSQGGYALGNLYYTPYVTMYEARFLYPYYVGALRQLPNSCGLFYVGNYLRSGDSDDSIQWTFNMPGSNDTVPPTSN